MAVPVGQFTLLVVPRDGRQGRLAIEWGHVSLDGTEDGALSGPTGPASNQFRVPRVLLDDGTPPNPHSAPALAASRCGAADVCAADGDRDFAAARSRRADPRTARGAARQSPRASTQRTDVRGVCGARAAGAESPHRPRADSASSPIAYRGRGCGCAGVP